MSLAPLLEPIESPLKQYIHEDMMDKRPTYNNKGKKKDKGEKHVNSNTESK